MSRESSKRHTGWLLLLLVAIAAVAAWLWLREDPRGVDATVSSVQRASRNAVTTAKVKTAFALSERVAAFAVDVDTADGVVTLEGEVDGEQTRQLAGDIARETSGVAEVRNRLRIDPGARPDAASQRFARRVGDLEIKAAVQEELLADEDLSGGGVMVSVESGVVRLDGRVPGAEHRLRAELAAGGVPGVESVDNALVVMEEPVAGDRDLQLAEAVEFALYSSRAFDLDGIDIAVREGTVGLQGEVRSRAELLLAERLAAEVDGVEEVANGLDVRSEPSPAAMPADPGSENADGDAGVDGEVSDAESGDG